MKKTKQNPLGLPPECEVCKSKGWIGCCIDINHKNTKCPKCGSQMDFLIEVNKYACREMECNYCISADKIKPNYENI